MRQQLRRLRLDLNVSDPTVRSTLEEAKDELAKELTGPNPTSLAAIAALALGDPGPASRLIRSHGPGELDTTYALLLLRYLTWTGIPYQTIDGEHWLETLQETTWGEGSADQGSALDPWQVSADELQIAAESIGVEGLPPTRIGEPAPGRRRRSLPTGSGTAESVEFYLRTLIGILPDAPRNRLVLRPELPESWDDLELQHLRFGDSEIDLTYRRDGEHHTFTLSQESGAIPAQLILEPALPGEKLRSAAVDGKPATLDYHRVDERIITPVQIVLDDLRTVELVVGREIGRTRIRLPVRQ